MQSEQDTKYFRGLSRIIIIAAIGTALSLIGAGIYVYRMVKGVQEVSHSSISNLSPSPLSNILENNTIYYVKNNENNFLLNGILYKERREPFHDNKKISRDEVDSLEKIPVITFLAGKVDFFMIHELKERSVIVFTMLISFDPAYIQHANSKVKKYREESEYIRSTYIYEVDTNTLSRVRIEDKVLIPIAMSDDNNYIAFNLFNCWNCEGPYPETGLFSLLDYRSDNIGRTTDYRWLNNGEYEYKEHIAIPCDPPDEMGEIAGYCYKDPEKLPFIKDTMALPD